MHDDCTYIPQVDVGTYNDFMYDDCTHIDCTCGFALLALCVTL